MLHGCPPSPDAWGRLNVVTPFHHLSGDSHINSSLREGPLRHLARATTVSIIPHRDASNPATRRSVQTWTDNLPYPDRVIGAPARHGGLTCTSGKLMTFEGRGGIAYLTGARPIAARPIRRSRQLRQPWICNTPSRNRRPSPPVRLRLQPAARGAKRPLLRASCNQSR